MLDDLFRYFLIRHIVFKAFHLILVEESMTKHMTLAKTKPVLYNIIVCLKFFISIANQLKIY